MENRIEELDGLRGIAVVLVMALHIFKRAAYFTEHPILETFTKFTTVGWVGVDIFFTLSGFLITSILLKSKTGEHYFRNFYVRRALRIFPLYYAAIALILLFAPKVEPEFIGQLNVALPVMLLYQQNWAMLFDGFHMSQYFGITWSLAIEEQFYLLWPLIVYRLDRERLVKFSLGYILVSWLARILVVSLWHDPGQAASFFFYASFARFEQVLIGGLLAIFLTFEGAQEQARRYSVPVFAVSFAIFIVLCLMSLPGDPHPDFGSLPLTYGGYTVSALFSAGLIGVFITHPPQNTLRRIFRFPPLAFLGKYSYSMYLFHMAAALILLDVFWHSELRGWKPFVLYPVAAYAATIMIALLTWHLLEKHMLNFKKYFTAVQTPK
jgi:peptidoglycan/LPS O-acetylase OafA/YrhL